MCGLDEWREQKRERGSSCVCVSGKPVSLSFLCHCALLAPYGPPTPPLQLSFLSPIATGCEPFPAMPSPCAPLSPLHGHCGLSPPVMSNVALEGLHSCTTSWLTLAEHGAGGHALGCGRSLAVSQRLQPETNPQGPQRGRENNLWNRHWLLTTARASGWVWTAPKPSGRSRRPAGLEFRE